MLCLLDSIKHCFKMSRVLLKFLSPTSKLLNNSLLTPKCLFSVKSVNATSKHKSNPTFCNVHFRKYSSNQNPTDGEQLLTSILMKTFPKASEIKVNDISGGCGEMYEVYVTSVDFQGKRTLQQHKQVTEALKNEVPKMHGLRIFTSVA